MPAVTLRDAVIVPPDVLAREIGGETVLLNLDTGLYFGLDAVGTDIWRRLCAGATLARTADELIAIYDVEPDVLQADILRLVNELAANGLVTTQPAPDEPQA